MTKRSLLVGAALSAAIAMAPAYADNHDGFYGNVGGGFAFAPDFKMTPTSSSNNTAKIQTKTGYNVTGAIGYKYDDFRVEGAVGYLRNKVDKADRAGTPLTTPTGRNTATTFMVNGYYDVNIDSTPQVTPYLGLGVGVARIKSNVRASADTRDFLDGSSNRFAYQGIVGLNYHFADNMAVGVDYRYITTSKKKVNYIATTGATYVEGKGRYSNNLLSANFSYYFS